MNNCSIPPSLKNIPLALSYETFIKLYWPGAMSCCRKLFNSSKKYSDHYYKFHRPKKENRSIFISVYFRDFHIRVKCERYLPACLPWFQVAGLDSSVYFPSTLFIRVRIPRKYIKKRLDMAQFLSNNQAMTQHHFIIRQMNIFCVLSLFAPSYYITIIFCKL